MGIKRWLVSQNRRFADWATGSTESIIVRDGGSEYHRQLILIAGFLGGIAFTALILLLGQYSNFVDLNAKHSGLWVFVPFLLWDLSAISATFITACVYALPIAGGTAPIGTRVDHLSRVLFRLGWFEVMLAIPALVEIISGWVSVAVIAMEIALLLLGRRMAGKDKKTPMTSKAPSNPKTTMSITKT